MQKHESIIAQYNFSPVTSSYCIGSSSCKETEDTIFSPNNKDTVHQFTIQKTKVRSSQEGSENNKKFLPSPQTYFTKSYSKLKIEETPTLPPFSFGASSDNEVNFSEKTSEEEGNLELNAKDIENNETLLKKIEYGMKQERKLQDNVSHVLIELQEIELDSCHQIIDLQAVLQSIKQESVERLSSLDLIGKVMQLNCQKEMINEIIARKQLFWQLKPRQSQVHNIDNMGKKDQSIENLKAIKQKLHQLLEKENQVKIFSQKILKRIKNSQSKLSDLKRNSECCFKFCEQSYQGSKCPHFRRVRELEQLVSVLSMHMQGFLQINKYTPQPQIQGKQDEADLFNFISLAANSNEKLLKDSIELKEKYRQLLELFQSLFSTAATTQIDFINDYSQDKENQVIFSNQQQKQQPMNSGKEEDKKKNKEVDNMINNDQKIAPLVDKNLSDQIASLGGNNILQSNKYSLKYQPYGSQTSRYHYEYKYNETADFFRNKNKIKNEQFKQKYFEYNKPSLQTQQNDNSQITKKRMETESTSSLLSTPRIEYNTSDGIKYYPHSIQNSHNKIESQLSLKTNQNKQMNQFSFKPLKSNISSQQINGTQQIKNLEQNSKTSYNSSPRLQASALR